MSGIDLALENLESQVDDLRQQFSAARKEGRDVTIASLKFMGLPPKLGVARATQDFQDIKKIGELIAEVKRELGESYPAGIAGGFPKGTDFAARAVALLAEERSARKSNDPKQLEKIYLEMRKVYPSAPDDLKKEIYKKSVELYNHLASVKKEGK